MIDFDDSAVVQQQSNDTGGTGSAADVKCVGYRQDGVPRPAVVAAAGQYPRARDVSVPPDECPLPRGENCAVYDSAAPARYRFRYYNRIYQKKQSNVQDEAKIDTKLNMLKLDNEKNPITKLNEIMFLKKKSIVYELVSLVGQVHNPNFTFRAKTDDIITYGSGSSKKDAKRNAAIAFLKLMENNNGNNTITSTTSNVLPSFSDGNHAEKILETKSELNPISLLQEFCMANRWQLPDYEYLVVESNTPQNSWYTVLCSLKMYKFKGEGITKQLAKRQAARLLYDSIKNLSQEEKDAINYSEYHSPNNIFLNNIDNIVKYGKHAEEMFTLVDLFFNQLKSSENPSINKLKQIDLNESRINAIVNAVDFLDEIGNEENFRVTYITLANKTPKFEILVQVTIYPMLIYLGSGNTLEAAQESAALATLLYLKLFSE